MRIQILELPAVVNGDNVLTPFALIFDQCPPEYHGNQPDGERMANLSNAAGASGFFATTETVDVVDRFQDVQVSSEFIEEVQR